MRSASIIYSSQMSYYLDHLGVLCYILDIPLYVTDSHLYKLAKKYYPQLNLTQRDPIDLSLQFLAQFDLLFVSDKFSASYLNHLLGTLFKKQLHFCFLPHGNSDKGQLDQLMSPYPLQEYCILYGPQMRQRLEKSGHLDKIKGVIEGGNLRRQFYEKYRSFYDALIEKELELDFRKRTILYAPTWKDQENSTSFFEVCETLLEQLPPDDNLIVKLHPFLEHYFPGKVYSLIERYQSKRVSFLIHFPLVYPLLSRADIYLGDFSAVGYDYLTFSRPMFFFNPLSRKDQGTHLHQCGITIPPDTANIFSFIEKNLHHDFGQIQKRNYENAFYPDRDFALIKQEINEMIV